MATIFCPKEDTLENIIEKIKESQDDSITLSIEKGSVYWQNSTNHNVLERLAKKYDKTITVDHRSEEQDTHVAESTDEASPAQASVVMEEEPEATKKKKSSSRLRSFFKFPRVLILIGLLLLLFAGSASAYVVYYLPRAEVVLSVSKKTLQKEETVVLRPEQESVDAATLSIPVTIETVNVEETRQFDSTGTKTVGEKATGTITVYNWDEEVAVQLPLGTGFVVNEGQEGAGFIFISTEAIPVPRATEETVGDSKTIVAGTAEVPVEAQDVGAIYNLPAELFFTVGNYAFGDDSGEVQGINEQLFSGGSTEEIAIVTEDDVLNAFETLKSDLEPRAREQLEQKQNGSRLITEHLPVNVLNNVADKEAEDEAESFSATTSIQATGYFYNQNHVRELLGSLLAEDVPDGFALSEDEMNVSVSYVGVTEEGFVQVSVSGEVLLIPELDIQALKSELSGENPSQAQEYIASLEHVSEGSIEIWPRLPGSLQRLPFRTERISIDIQEE